MKKIYWSAIPLLGLFLSCALLGSPYQASAASIGTVYSICSGQVVASMALVDTSLHQSFVYGACFTGNFYADVTITAARTVKLSCPSNSNFNLTFTGPRTASISGSASGLTSTSCSSTYIVVDVAPIQVPTISSASVTSSGSTVSISGTGFTSTENTVLIQPATGSSSLTPNVSSSDGKSLSIDAPSGMFGAATVSVSNANGTSNSVPLINDAPSNLSATWDPSVIGNVDLSWTDNSTDETGFLIQRADVDNPTDADYHSANSVGSNITSYTDPIPTSSGGSDPIVGSKISYRVKALKSGNTSSSYSDTAALSNCTPISGNGPIKVVFMRSQGFELTTQEFIDQANKVITQGFDVIDPYRTYINKFSFYIDLHVLDDSQFVVDSTDNTTWDYSADKVVTSHSGCGANQDMYMFYETVPGRWPAYAERDDQVIFFDTLDTVHAGADALAATTAIHESGHALGGLYDEYTSSTAAPTPDTDWFNWGNDPENCSSNPLDDFKSSLDNRMYGTVYNVTNSANAVTGYVGSPGCSYLQSKFLGAAYYRPSESSIMLSVVQPNPKFNVISCGYLVAAIMGENTTKANAEKYWPDCRDKMDTDGKSSLPALSPTPSMYLPTTKATAGDLMKITGSGYTPAGNAVRFILSSQPTSMNSVSDVFAYVVGLFSPSAKAETIGTTYEVSDVTSSDGTSLNFAIPSNMPSGTYTVQVGAFNSDWSTGSTMTIAAGAGYVPPPVIPPVISPPTPPTGALTVPATLAYSCSSGYTLVNASQCYKPAQTVPASSFAATATHSCNPGDTVLAGGASCVGPYISTPYPATTLYSCPSGASLSGTTCNVPASTVPASTVNANTTYACPSGYNLSGTTCNLNTAPSNLGATASAGQVVLSWSRNPARGESGFSIERTAAGKSTFTALSTVAAGVTSYTDSTVVSGSKYQYRVRASFSDSTYSDYSNAVSVTATKVTTPSLKISVTSASALSLSWSDKDSGITGYTVTDSTGAVITKGTTATTYSVTGLIPATKYCYTVQAIVGSVAGSPSSSVCGTTQAPGMALSVTSASALVGTVTFSLSNTNTVTHVTSVDLYINSVKKVTASLAPWGLAFNTTALTNGKYSVYAVVNFDSGAKFTTKTISVTIKNTAATSAAAPTKSSLVNEAPQVSSVDITAAPASADVTQIPTASVTSTSNASSVPAAPALPAPTSPSAAPASAPAVASPAIVPPPVMAPLVPTTIPATASYACPSGYDLMSGAFLCRNQKHEIKKASASYSCPSGYTLNSSAKTCAQNIVSMLVSTSTSTASVWDAFQGWIAWFMGWERGR